MFFAQAALGARHVSGAPAMAPLIQFRHMAGQSGKRASAPSAASAAPLLSTDQAIAMEERYAAHNYHPLGVVFHKARGVDVWDPEGRHYFDFLSAYSAVNQGHCHPKIVAALTAQAQLVTLSSRAFHNDVFPRFAKFVTEYFGYDRVLPMNTGMEAVETAFKLARRWAYDVKGVSPDDALIVACEGSFHGRSMAAISMSTDPSSRGGYGPFVPNVVHVPHGDVAALGALFEREGKRIAGFIVEPIQGEAGIVVPHTGYLGEVQTLCRKHNVLLVADEVQTGLCRTGRLLAQEWDGARADIVVLGKAISGGVLPLSVVLASDEVMLTIKPGQHGSTYGGNPLASAVGIAALEVLRDEKLAENAQRLGDRLRAALHSAPAAVVSLVRGRGLLNAIVVNDTCLVSATDICYMFKDAGLLAKPTHDTIIRLAPPLCITDEQMDKAIGIILKVLAEAHARHNKALVASLSAPGRRESRWLA